MCIRDSPQALRWQDPRTDSSHSFCVLFHNLKAQASLFNKYQASRYPSHRPVAYTHLDVYKRQDLP